MFQKIALASQMQSSAIKNKRNSELLKSVKIIPYTAVIFYLRIPSPILTFFCFGTHTLNLSESPDSQNHSGKFCSGCNYFIVGLSL